MIYYSNYVYGTSDQVGPGERPPGTNIEISVPSFTDHLHMEMHEQNGQQPQQYHYIWEISDVERLRQVQNILFISETSSAPLTNLSEF